MLDDRIHTLAYGHKDITTKVVSIWEGPEIFIISADEGKSKGLHPSRRIDPDTIQPRAPMMSYWKARIKTALDQVKKRILEGMSADKQAAINDESSEEEATLKDKMPLSYHWTTSPTLDLKPNYPPTIASSNIAHQPSSTLSHQQLPPPSLTSNLPNPTIHCPLRPCDLPATLTRLPLKMTP